LGTVQRDFATEGRRRLSLFRRDLREPAAGESRFDLSVAVEQANGDPPCRSWSR